MSKRSTRSAGQRALAICALIALVFSLGALGTSSSPSESSSASTAPQSPSSQSTQQPSAPTPGNQLQQAVANSGPTLAMMSRNTERYGLSGRLAQLASPGLRDKSEAEQAQALSLPDSGPGSLFRGPDGSVRVSIPVLTTKPSMIARLEQAGASIMEIAHSFSTVTATVPVSRLNDVANTAGVVSVDPVLAPQLYGSAAPCDPLASSANTQLRAALARSSYSVDGTGVTVGVLSDSYATRTSPTSAADDVSTGALPGAAGNTCGFTTPVNVVQEYPGTGTDEGRAMLQLIHSVAPGANLSFATAFISETGFAQNILALKDAGAKVIVDDVSYSSEPMFQDGPIAVAINTVTAAGVAYFSAAGNGNIIVNGKNVGSVEVPAYSPTTCPSQITSVGSCMDFGGGDSTSSYTIPAGQKFAVVMNWAEPMYGVTTDLDLFLIDNVTGQVAASSAYGIAVDRPFEGLSWTNPDGSNARSVSLVIGRKNGYTGTPRVKYIMWMNGGTVTSAEYNQSTANLTVGPTIFGHAAASTGITVAATDYRSGSSPETFSSRGPVTLYFGPYNGNTPAASLQAPLALARPDITATDGDCTTFFGSAWSPPTCPYAFFGTSAAAPNAAAVGALLLQKNSALTPEEIRTDLRATAAAMSGGANSSGAGLVDAVAAVASAAGAPSPPLGVTGVRSGSGSVALSWSPPMMNPNAITSYTATAYITQFGSPVATTFTCTSSGSPAVAGCTVSGLTNGTAYTFTVTATNSVGASLSSVRSSEVIPAAVPDPPTSVQIPQIPTDGSAALTWTAPASNGGMTITSYKAIAYGGIDNQPSGQSCNSTGNPAAATCTITGLTNGGSYYFKVIATNGVGDSSPSTQSGYYQPFGTPPTPTNLAGSPGNGYVDLNWQIPQNNSGISINGFTVRANPLTVMPGGNPECYVNPDVTSCRISGLTNGTAYTFAIRVQTIYGAGTFGPETSDYTPTAATAPNAPTAVVVPSTPQNGQATLTWTAPSDGGSTITSYTATAYVTGSATTLTCISTGSPATPGCTITGLTNGAAYTFRVFATNASGDSELSDASDGYTPASRPATPLITSVLSGNHTISVTWTILDNGGSVITGYTASTSSGEHCTTTAQSCTISGLANAVSYTVTVSATNVIGTSDESPPQSATPGGPPEQPVIVSAVAGVASATITWTPAVSGSTATQYVVTAYPGGANCTTSTTSCVISGLTAGTTYMFTVTPSNPDGQGPASAPSGGVVPASVPVTPPPAQPAPAATTPSGVGVSAVKAKKGKATVKILAGSNGGSAIIRYEYRIAIKKKLNKTKWKRISATAASVTVKSLKKNQVYVFQIRAVNAVGTGTVSTIKIKPKK